MKKVPDKEEIRRMKRRAYVDAARGVIKVIIGDDEWQIEFKVTNSMDAKKNILNGDYLLKNVTQAVIDDNVRSTREKLAQLSASVVSIYETAEHQEGFNLFSTETRKKTDELAHEIQLIQSYGMRK